jgi:signal transduction histidine kinase
MQSTASRLQNDSGIRKTAAWGFRPVLLLIVASIPLCSLSSVTLAQPPVTTSTAPSAPDVRANVLFVDEQVVTRPVIQEMMAGFRTFFLEHPENAPEVFAESLDLSRLRVAQIASSEASAAESTAWLTQKYNGIRLDVLVAANARVFPLLVALRDQIAPQAWILTMERFGESLNPSGAIPNVAILRSEDASIGALQLTTQLFPTTRRVAFVGTSFPHAQSTMAAVAFFEAECRKTSLEFEPLIDLELSELTQRLRQLPPDSVVYYSAVHTNGSGQRVVPAEVVDYLSRETPRPIIAGIDVYLGRGIVGGVCTEAKTVGRMMAEMVRDYIANGTVADRTMIPAVILDARVLDRFSVPDSRIPASAEVRFQQPGFFRQYWPQTLAGILIFSSQAWLIGTLLITLRHRRQAEQQIARHQELLQHASRLSTLGQYAATLAHELGQPLGAILNNIETAEHLLSLDPEKHLDELRDIIHDIAEDDRRAGRVLDSIRSMVRRQQPAQHPLSLAELVQNTLVLVRSTMNSQRISLTVACEAAQPLISGDEVLLQQAVLNLLNNSVQAFQQRKVTRNSNAPSGLLSSESMRERAAADSIRIEIRPAASFSPAQFDSCIELAILDNAGGIDSSVERSVTEAFFTTRASGLGIGLSIVQSIMEQHDGQMVLQNQPGIGLTVRLLFPTEPRKKLT